MIKVLALVLPMLVLPTAEFANAAIRYCAGREQVIKKLENIYGEVIAYRGLNGRGSILEVAVSPNRTFTIFLTDVNKFSCTIATGFAWEVLNPPKGQPT